MCRVCHGRSLRYQDVGGIGEVFSYTVNWHPWRPGLKVPYIIAMVELAEQEGLRLTTNLVNCEPGDLHIGLSVRVVFDQQDEYYVPIFEPVRPGGRDVG
jgi:hypothetical protein